MMNPVHVWGYQKGTQPAVHFFRQPDISMIKQRSSVKKDFKNQYCAYRWTKSSDGSQLDAGGKKYFQGMKAQPG